MSSSISVIIQYTAARCKQTVTRCYQDKQEQGSYFESIRQLIRFLIKWVREGQMQCLNYKQNPKVQDYMSNLKWSPPAVKNRKLTPVYLEHACYICQKCWHPI